MKIKIKLKTVKDVSLFVAKCNEFSSDIDFLYGRYMIDAKSLMGVLSIGLDKECNAEIHSTNEAVVKCFKQDMALWEIR